MNDTASEPRFFIRGEKVGLGPMRKDLLETYTRWVNTLQVTRTLGIPNLPMTVEREQGWLDAALTSTDPLFTIYELTSSRPIGNTGLADIDHASGTATFGLLIGETDAWGKGFGTETTRLMLNYGFDVLGLHNIDLQVFAHNPGGIKAYERAGFKKVGVRRGARKVGRVRYDIVYMDAVADEIEPSPLHKLMQTGSIE
jgi:RimJ/RimL family protein N-acetyltransferase